MNSTVIKRVGKYLSVTTVLLIVASVIVAVTSRPVAAKNRPHIANYYLRWELNDAEARELARWDLVVLDMEIQHRRPDLLRKLREWNPDIILLVYITPQEIRQDASGSYSQMRRKLAAGIDSRWYLTNAQGQRLTWWTGTYLLNVTNEGPLASGQRFNQYLVHFVVNELLATGLWDGVFYDNAWDNITHFAGHNVDSNADGRVDTKPDQTWQAGMKFIYNETRRLAPGKIIVGNGTTRAYRNELDGNIIENFTPQAWSPTMETYRYNQGDGRYNIINANTGNKGGNGDYRSVRFGLGSTLLEDGYFSYDYGDQDHGQVWHYDEYDINLGKPINGSASRAGHTAYQPDVWRRDFEHGIAVVNSTPDLVTVDLGGEFEKIKGKQDPNVNDGSIVSETALNGYDGLLLMKTFSSLNDTIFTNGAFARFLRANGERARNGFFVFEDAYKGGDQIARIDLDGNGERDLLVASGPKLQAWRDDGQPFIKAYPYGVDYPGTLNLALGDLIGDDGQLEVVVAPSSGQARPVKMYGHDGHEIRTDWFPFGNKYKGGYTIAIGKTGPENRARLIVGSGTGRAAAVAVYDATLNRVAEWPAFEASFKNGISVASGDIDGDGQDEVIVGAGPGKGPVVKVFNESGKLLYDQFNAYSTFNKSGIEVRVGDVDFDGRDEIIALSDGIGL